MIGLDLVVGGGGFIGSHVVEGLLAEGRQVRVLDDFSTGHAHNLDGLDCQVMEGDAAEESTARAAAADVERIFHLGARPSVPWSFEFPELAEQANYQTTLSLIAAAQHHGIRRLVFSSSSAIYGDAPKLPKAENMQPAPQSPYAEHKLQGEVALAAAAKDFGLESVSLRYFNVFGPRQDPSSPYSGVISLFARWLHEGKNPTFYGDGLQTRDFVFVKDVVRANLAAASVPLSTPARILNIGCGRSVSILDLWATLCRVAGKETGEPHFLPARQGDVRHSCASIARAQQELGFQPQFTLEQGLALTLGFPQP